MQREEFERTLSEFYATRMSNDADLVLGLFAKDAAFEIVGSPEESPAMRASAESPDFADIMREVVKTWVWKNRKPLSTLIEGDSATAMYELTVVFTPTGEEITMRIVDIWHVEGGKIKTLTEFVDTALLARLAADAAKSNR